MTDIYPITIIKDRYNGSFSGAIFTAWKLNFNAIPVEVVATDEVCCAFWDTYGEKGIIMGNGAPLLVGKGPTPASAYRDLLKQIKQSKK